jgi:hypothetical protein
MNLKKHFEKWHKSFFFIDKENYCCLVGQRCSYYIFVCKNGAGYTGPWMNGRDWNSFWDESILLNKKPELMEKLVSQYNKFAPVINKRGIK